jgi:uncharacterized protein YjfI (DUF2170 family)
VHEELPIFITITDTQIIFISYLWHNNVIKTDRISELYKVMLEMNVPIPLSSLCIISNRYTLFGACSINSSRKDIRHEIITLSSNGPDVINYFKTFLK